MTPVDRKTQRALAAVQADILPLTEESELAPMAKNTVRHMDRTTGKLESVHGALSKQEMAARNFIRFLASTFGVTAVSLIPGFQWNGAIISVLAALLLWLIAHYWESISPSLSPRVRDGLVGMATGVRWYAAVILVLFCYAVGPSFVERVRNALGQSEWERRIAVLEAKIKHLQREADQRRILLYGKDGKGGVEGELKNLLNGAEMLAPPGYVFSGQMVRLNSYPPLFLTVDANQRRGPCVKLRNVGSLKGKNWTCENHPIGVDADKLKSFDLQGSSTK